MHICGGILYVELMEGEIIYHRVCITGKSASISEDTTISS
jgi:hypothetical protein